MSVFAAVGWDVVAVIEDRDGLFPLEGRTGLKSAIERIERKEVGALLNALADDGLARS